MPYLLQWREWIELRDKYKGHTIGSRIRRIFGSYNPSGGSLSELNQAVERYCRHRTPAALLAVHQAIEAVAGTPKVEKYGMLLAELVLLIPDRPPGRRIGPDVNGELVRFFADAQASAAYRVFIEGTYQGTPEIEWKSGSLRSMKNMLNAWTDAAKDVVSEMAESTEDEAIENLAELVQDDAAVKRTGEAAVSGLPLSRSASAASDIRSAALRHLPMAAPDVTGSVPDVYELARAGPEGFPGDSIDLNSITPDNVGEQLSVLADGSGGAEILGLETADACMSALGTGLAFLGLFQGAASEIRAAIEAYHAHELLSAYGIVPFGNASAAIGGIRGILERHAAELAALGAVDIGSGALALAGTGPIGGIVGAGIKILLRVAYAMRDAKEVQKAREYLLRGSQWHEKSFVMKVMSEVPLFGAYFLMTASKSDLIGFLSNADTFNPRSFQTEVERINPQYDYIRNMANQCQLTSMWGFKNLPGWKQNLDTRWYKQPQKEAYNAMQEFKRADTRAMRARAEWNARRARAFIEGLREE